MNTHIQQVTASFLKQQEQQGNTPDMLAIMDHVSNKLSCEPIEVLRNMGTLQRNLKVSRTHKGLTTTYRLIHNL